MTRVRRFATLITLAVAVVAFAAGCAKPAPAPPPAPPPAAAPAPPPPPPPPPPPAPAPAPTEEEIFAKKTLDQLNAEKPIADVFFDLDESTIREDARPSLQKGAEWLKRWSSSQITVEGHCDSRGSSEYNLGLGSRRAQAVKDYLVSLGIPAGRVAIVSKGKEQPFCNEESEACWQQNRRGHFIITGK